MSPFKSKEGEYSSGYFYRLNEDPQISLDVKTENTANLEIPHPNLEVHVRSPERREGIEVPKIALKGKEGLEVVIYDRSAQEVRRLGWEPSKEERVEKMKEEIISKRYFSEVKRLQEYLVHLKRDEKRIERGGFIKTMEEVRFRLIEVGGAIALPFVAVADGIFRLIPLYIYDRNTGKLKELVRQSLEAERQSSEDRHS
jgi:hypothetical protein